MATGTSPCAPSTQQGRNKLGPEPRLEPSFLVSLRPATPIARDPDAARRASSPAVVAQLCAREFRRGRRGVDRSSLRLELAPAERKTTSKSQIRSTISLMHVIDHARREAFRAGAPLRAHTGGDVRAACCAPHAVATLPQFAARRVFAAAQNFAMFWGRTRAGYSSERQVGPPAHPVLRRRYRSPIPHAIPLQKNYVRYRHNGVSSRLDIFRQVFDIAPDILITGT